MSEVRDRLDGVPGRPTPGAPAPFDPLKLCIFATVALLTWIFGALAVLVFAVLGLTGYWRAHRAGLTRSKCYLRDVRLVLAYLLGLTLVSGGFVVAWVIGRV